MGVATGSNPLRILARFDIIDEQGAKYDSLLRREYCAEEQFYPGTIIPGNTSVSGRSVIPPGAILVFRDITHKKLTQQ